MKSNPYLAPLQQLLASHRLDGHVFLKPDLLAGQVAETSFNTGRYDNYVWIAYQHPTSSYTFIHGVSPTGEISAFESSAGIDELSEEGPCLLNAGSETEVVHFLEEHLASPGY